MERMDKQPRTRAEMNGIRFEERIDPDTGELHSVAISPSGRVIDKNRSDHEAGYKSHLTAEQVKLIVWALRQRDRGISRARVAAAVREKGWKPQPMQYPLTPGTIMAWELTRNAMAARGRQWPVLTKNVEDSDDG